MGRRDGRRLRIWRGRGGRFGARRRLCLGIGSSAIALFLVLRGFNLYGDPPWDAGRGRRPADAGPVRLPEHDQVSSLVGLSVDDAWPDDSAGTAGDSAGNSCAMACSIRPGAVLLLRAPYPVDSPPGDRRVDGHAGVGEPLAIRKSPDGQPAAPGLHMESGTPLRRLGGTVVLSTSRAVGSPT